ncbi:Small acidic protein 1 [Acorus gramineus]|uniref:Small acidic protein 1 n=1 Tax=Acorus gramineus TaxID=55184 RepID=A0AAV9AST9_ACOGR|nr:Small acidic protein 1 [Acorus gramineus]
MRPSLLGPAYDMDEQGSTVGMDLDDSDTLDLLEGIIDKHPVDSDFFNSFEDDFDDTDIN